MSVYREYGKFDVIEIFSGCGMDGNGWGSCPKGFNIRYVGLSGYAIKDFIKFGRFGYWFSTSVFCFEYLN
jgi:hypothetical protein